jgi:hypothetical protein
MILRLAAATAALALLAASALAAPPAKAAASAKLDVIAKDFVRLTLEAGEREPGYVDAYYGPADWATAAKAKPREVPALRAEADRLAAALKAVDGKALSPDEVRRKAFLAGQVKAAQTRLAMLAGVKFSFQDEAEGLFGVRPPIKPLSAYDPDPGQDRQAGPRRGRPGDPRHRLPGPLHHPDRPAGAGDEGGDRRVQGAHGSPHRPAQGRALRPLVRHQEALERLQLVQGRRPQPDRGQHRPAHPDQPRRRPGLPRGLSGPPCAERPAGREADQGKGWVEFSVYPLFSPQSLIAEGSANYGIRLAFPGDEKLAFERKTLYPLAGLDPATAQTYDALPAPPPTWPASRTPSPTSICRERWTRRPPSPPWPSTP